MMRGADTTWTGMAIQRRRLLLVSFHYPPIQGSSGVHRALAFSRYLPDFGWDVTVLTVHQRAHEATARENLSLIPAGVEILRAQAWDAARHFAVAGRFPDILATPDRWASWIVFGVRAGVRAIRSDKYDAIFSTFPVASAHVIASRIHRISGLPWIADFRDPMATPTYPHEAALRSTWMRIQDEACRAASAITVTAPGAARFYRERYVDLDPNRVVVIENGFDPEAFEQVSPTIKSEEQAGARSCEMTLLHSGILYPRERDPTAFLRAVRRLLERGSLGDTRLRVRFRASGFEAEYRNVIAANSLQDVVELLPPVSYRDAVAEMRRASALLVFQGRYCNEQIPAKAYEYLYAGRPVLGLADPDGDTAQLLRRFGVQGIAALENEEAILRMLESSLRAIREGTYSAPNHESVMSLSRRSGAKQLATLLHRAVESTASRPQGARDRT
jgi:glycosyltransferase involved in cell wall biosynthesis